MNYVKLRSDSNFSLDSNLDMYLDKEESVRSADYHHFPSKLFAMLYFLLHGPKPMVIYVY